MQIDVIHRTWWFLFRSRPGEIYEKTELVCLYNSRLVFKQRCWDARQISERYDNYNIPSRGFEPSRDLAGRCRTFQRKEAYKSIPTQSSMKWTDYSHQHYIILPLLPLHSTVCIQYVAMSAAMVGWLVAFCSYTHLPPDAEEHNSAV